MKTYDVFLTPDAVSDLESIYEYLCSETGYPEMAWTYIEKLRAKCQNLRTAPIRGQRRDDLRKNLRIVALDKRTVAAFEVNENQHAVTILNIFYGGRDYETIMRYTDQN